MNSASALTPDHIPEELKALDRWVCHRAKQPADPKTGYPAAVNQPATWAPYAQALAAYQRGGFDGLGFVFNGDGIVGVDLDKCRDPQGEIEPWAAEIVRILNGYAEVSPSGTGLHVLVRGELPPGRCRKGRVEAYATGRYFTVTGRALGDRRDVPERQAELEAFHAEHLADPEPVAAVTLEVGTSILTDEEVLEKAHAASNGGKFSALFDAGDLSAYKDDQSAADLALLSMLAFWCRRDAEQMERLFSESALGQREKWQGREDYRARTIERAIAGCREVYGPADPGDVFNPIQAAPAAAPAVVVRNPFAVANIEDLSFERLGRTPPKPARWFMGGVNDGGLPKGKIALIAGHGGSGKSTLALQIAASVASGRDFTGGVFKFHTTGPALFLTAEDETEDLDERAYHLRRMVEGEVNLSRLYVVRGAGDYRFMERDRCGNLQPSARYREALALARRIRPRVLVLDPVAQFMGAASELDNNEMEILAAHLRVLLAESGAEVMFSIAHVNKASGKDLDSTKKLETALAPGAVRGATALVNAHRWLLTTVSVPPTLAATLGAASDTLLQGWRVAKSNYSKTTGMNYFRRGDGGLLVPYKGDFMMDDLNRVEQAIAESETPLTARSALDVLPVALGMSKATVKKLIAQGLELGRLVEEERENSRGKSTRYVMAWWGADVDEEMRRLLA
ncbi:AAA family ATPase [Desulfovibrio aminophilus]|uniref:phage NrS-1 polymerase family protein n=1 Tax=Desulfovibrio aminophilus TaxID=81425 RepID=UPI00042267B7|nr:AAA family ATPase [Desulfovibrio aminophilus]